MSMFTDLVKQGKVVATSVMSVASKLNLVVGDIISHGGKIPAKFRFVKKTNEVAYLKVTLDDGTEPKGAIVINDDGEDQVIAFFHPNYTGKEAWDMIHGSDEDVLKLSQDENMEEQKFLYKPQTATAWGDVDASYYDVVYWCIKHYSS